MIAMFGGQAEAKFFNDLMTFDLNDLGMRERELRWNYWHRHAGVNSSDPVYAVKPQARANSTMVSFNDELYL